MLSSTFAPTLTDQDRELLLPVTNDPTTRLFTALSEGAGCPGTASSPFGLLSTLFPILLSPILSDPFGLNPGKPVFLRF